VNGADIALILITVLTGFAIYKVDKVLTRVIQIDTTLCGIDGKGGILGDVSSLRESRGQHADRIESLEAQTETNKAEISFLRKRISGKGETP